MEKKQKRLELLKELGDFLLTKDFTGDQLAFSSDGLLILGVVTKETVEFGQILINFSYFGDETKQINVMDPSASEKLVKIIDQVTLHNVTISISGAAGKSNKAFDIRLKKVIANGKDYGHNHEMHELWRLVGKRITLSIKEREQEKSRNKESILN